MPGITVPELDIEAMIGVVKVLFVRVSLPVRVANVTDPVGKVTVPEFEIVEIIGVVMAAEATLHGRHQLTAA